jgi:argininosuccinate lyase
MFSVEEVNKLVLQGMPFRDAYMQVGRAIEAGGFTWQPQVQHTHEGSIGNLCTQQVKEMKDAVVAGFCFQNIQAALHQLITGTT